MNYEAISSLTHTRDEATIRGSNWSPSATGRRKGQDTSDVKIGSPPIHRLPSPPATAADPLAQRVSFDFFPRHLATPRYRTNIDPDGITPRRRMMMDIFLGHRSKKAAGHT
ncbi:unnamed protein product [Zymoseptoria tritici ST99CH_1E4]|uniref:Uncharacterized protein n=1 Tax=Zymoseptoria tritici ST99CH_1E4 TaxID=1276532 RepID=A0A2H1H943_ZYMTR|nr:unnamed protein product [Zymoseptoria tritici ST99CH_1E4]